MAIAKWRPIIIQQKYKANGKSPFCCSDESAYGTKQTSQQWFAMSAFGGKADIANKFIRLSVTATVRIRLMKWILDRIGHVIGIRSQEPASGHDPITPADPHETDEADSSRRVEVNFDAKRKELGVDDSLKDVPGVTTPMLVAFGEHGIKSIEDLADCATDDLDGWSESKDGKTIRHAGILDRFKVSREDCETLIINARIKAGWIK